MAKNRASPRFLGHVEMLGNEGEGPFGPFWATQVVFEGQKRGKKEGILGYLGGKRKGDNEDNPFRGLKL